MPLGAYQIASQLEPKDPRRHAVAIYRSLHRLTSRRAIERVASVYAYRLLDTPKAALMVCEICGSVTSLPVPALHDRLAVLVTETGFVAEHLFLEAVGLRRECQGL